jgi:probable addiction module antidote protein
MSQRTETSYVYCILDFIRFHGKRRPKVMEVEEIRAYLSHLATEDNVSASTQNVALSALLFLYKTVLEHPLPENLEACLEDDDPALIAATLGDIARARGMSQVARETGLSRESLYKALSGEGNPAFATVMKVVKALGLRLQAEPVST